MTRLPAWTIIGVLAAMLLGTIHALVLYVLDLRSFGTLAPRDATQDGFGPDGYSSGPCG